MGAYATIYITRTSKRQLLNIHEKKGIFNMHKTNIISGNDAKLAVDIVGLQGVLGTGKATARQIAEEAGAVLTFGRRRLYNLKKIENYLDRVAK